MKEQVQRYYNYVYSMLQFTLLQEIWQCLTVFIIRVNFLRIELWIVNKVTR